MSKPKSRCIFNIRSHVKSSRECGCPNETSAEPQQENTNIQEKSNVECDEKKFYDGYPHPILKKVLSTAQQSNNQKLQRERYHSMVNSDLYANRRETLIQRTNRDQYKRPLEGSRAQEKSAIFESTTTQCASSIKNDVAYNTRKQNFHPNCVDVQFRENLGEINTMNKVCIHNHVANHNHVRNHDHEINYNHDANHVDHCHGVTHCQNHGNYAFSHNMMHNFCSHNSRHHSMDDSLANNIQYHKLHHCDNHHAKKSCHHLHGLSTENSFDRGQLAPSHQIELSYIEQILKKTEKYKLDGMNNNAPKTYDDKNTKSKYKLAQRSESLDDVPTTEYQSSYGKFHDTSSILEARRRSLKMVRDRNRDSFSKFQNEPKPLSSRLKRVSYEGVPNTWNLESASAPRLR
nr:PREDICTED: uncharacterized protein LOC109033134 [Bemisia tabaci]